MSLENPNIIAEAISCSASLLFVAFSLVAMGWNAANIPIGKMWPMGHVYSEHAKSHANIIDTTKPHPQGGAFSVVCYGVSLYFTILALSPFVNAALKYDLLSLAPNSNVLTVRYALLQAPRSVTPEALNAINVERKYNVGSHNTYSYSWRVIVETKSNDLIEPAWYVELSDKDNPRGAELEFSQLKSFVNEIERRNMPLKFSCIDRQGKIQTESRSECFQIAK